MSGFQGRVRAPVKLILGGVRKRAASVGRVGQDDRPGSIQHPQETRARFHLADFQLSRFHDRRRRPACENTTISLQSDLAGNRRRLNMGPAERPCGCAGSNENCTRCGGRGTYIPRVAKRSDGGHPCRWCGLQFGSGLLQNHLTQCAMRPALYAPIVKTKTKTHRPVAKMTGSAIPAVLPGISNDGCTVCSVCGAELKSHRLKKHMAKVHFVEQSKTVSALPGFGRAKRKTIVSVRPGPS